MDQSMQFDKFLGREAGQQHDGSSITELFGKEELETIMQKIASATGLAFVTVDYRGESVTDDISFCSFCSKIQKDPERAKLCAASNAFGAIQAAVFRKTFIYFCPCGLLEVAIPIEVRGQYLGGFIGGQIQCDDAPANIPHLDQVMHHQKDYTRDPDYAEDYKKILRLPYQQYVHITELVSLIVNQLGEKEMANMMLQKSHASQEALIVEKEQRIRLEKDLNEARRLELQTQLSPYFLTSALTTISNLAAVEHAFKTNEVITTLAKFLSDAWKHKGKTSYVASEMKIAEYYLSIQKLRLEERLNYSIACSEEASRQKILNMLVFPIVERAVYYGILLKKVAGSIQIKAVVEQDEVVITVTDDGPGFRDVDLTEYSAEFREEYQNISIEAGIESSRLRLRKAFGDKGTLAIAPEPQKGTVCTIRFPKSAKEEGA